MAGSARLTLALLAATVVSVEAQGVVTLRGLAYDSVAHRPLAGAFITLSAARSTTSDAVGLFAFDSVAPGTHRLEMVHAVLDSMGLPGVAIQATVTDGVDGVLLAVPGFASLWRAVCGERRPPSDSAFVYGTVRGTDRQPVAGATIQLGWTDFHLKNIRTIEGKVYRSEIESDERGEFAICGVPRDAGLRIIASRSELASGIIDVGPTNLRVIRRDLLIGPLDTTAAELLGSVAGIVTDTAGRPFDGATIVLDDVQQARTGPDGRFRLQNVRAGTRQVEILAIGLRPQLLVLDVVAKETVNVSASLVRVTMLDEVRITASRWQVRLLENMEARRHQGFGKFLDSTDLARRPTMGSAFSGLPSIDVRHGRGGQLTVLFPGRMSAKCQAVIYVDGLVATPEELSVMFPQDIAVLESYPRRALVPAEFQRGMGECGVIVIWTKRMMP